MRAVRFGIAGAVVILEAIAAAALVASSDHDSQPWLTAAFAITAGLTFVAAGLVALWRRPDNRTGTWLAATGYLWFLAALTESDNSWVFTVGFIFANLALVAFTTLILSYPTGILTPFEVGLVVVGGSVAIGGSAITALLDPSPATNCDECPGSAIAVTDAPSAVRIVTAVGTALIVAVLVTVVVILVRRWRHASVASRRLLRPVFLTCGVSVALLLLSVATDQISSRAYSTSWILFLLSFALVPLSFLAGVLRSRIDRSAAAAKMLLSLDAGIPLHDALADALHDPSLEIVYWLDDRGGWVDELGQEVPEPVPRPTRSVTTVEWEGRRIAALVHDPALDEERELVELTAAGARLPLENVRLQAELRAQFLILETVANTVPSMLMMLDTNGRILSHNQATLAATGLESREQLTGRHFWEAFGDREDESGVRRRFLAAAPEFAAAHAESAFTDRQGELRVIEWRSAPVTDASGRVTSIVAGGLDITERKQREVQLQRERDITETLMQAIPSLVVVVDGDATIVDSGVDPSRAGVNNTFRDALGWPESALVRQPVTRFIHTGDRDGALAAIASTADGVAAPERESRWLRADGGQLDIAWTATPVADVTGRAASLVLISGVDVTERKRHEEEVRASRSRIIEATDEARRKLERNLHDGAQQRLVSLSVSLRLAESLLESNTAEAGRVLVGARGELAAALEELRELARGIHPAVLTDRGLHAAVEALVTRTPLPVAVEMPPDRLPASIEAAVYYVISEAVTNIVKYAGATAIEVAVETGEIGVTVVVSDDGCGGADPAAGSGLRGLRDRVAALDGTLSIESPADRGTTITARIPLETQPGLPR